MKELRDIWTALRTAWRAGKTQFYRTRWKQRVRASLYDPFA